MTANSLNKSISFDIPDLEERSKKIRATCVQMSHDGKEGHLASALSCVDLIVALYGGWLNVDPKEPKHSGRDRLFFSKGHACTALYAVLADRGFIPKEQLSTYAQSGSSLPNHPCTHSLPVLEFSSGSLGHGLGVASGVAYGLAMDDNPARTVVLMSDGECNEGSVWEAAMFAAANHQERILAIVDYNGIQAVGRSDAIMGHTSPTSLEEKFRSFGWGACTINGNDLHEIVDALNSYPFEPGKPSVIVANTVGGAGISFMEDQVVWHYRVPPEDELKQALAELNATPIHLE